VLGAASILFFLWVAGILRRKPAIGMIVPLFALMMPQLQSTSPMVGRMTSFLFYLLFLGPGEEFFFRGYIQSRLNAAFGKPFNFWGVRWGWGLIIASLLFGLMHVLNPFNPFLGKFDLYWWWGAWTIFGGFLLGYIREKPATYCHPPSCTVCRRRSPPCYWVSLAFADPEKWTIKKPAGETGWLLVPQAGIEPTTLALGVLCSIR
jgi:hypothetical protein